MYSETVQSVDPSPSIRLMDKVAELRTQGHEIIGSASAPDLPTPDHICEHAIEAVRSGKTDYTDSTGIPEFRESIAMKLQEENQLSVTADDIIVTPGSKFALFESIFSLLTPGDEVIVLDPTWVSYEPIVRLSQGKVRHVELDYEDGFGIDGSKIKNAISEKTKALILTNPSTGGAVYSQEELQTVRNLSVENDFWVISDEIYEKVSYVEHHSIGSMSDMADRTITTNGFSKGYAMPGWRLGYLTAPTELLDQIKKVHTNSVTCANSFAQHGGIAALEGPQAPINDIREIYRKRRDVLVELLTDHGIDCQKPEGGFYVFVRTGKRDNSKLAEEILEKERIVTSPGDIFGVDGFLRFTLWDKESMKEHIESVVKYLK